MIRLLIADDEERIREVIKEYAKFEGYMVDEAKDGMEAIQKSNTNEYDLIIMDIMMPKLDGFSAVKEIRKKFKTPILMLSARGEEYDKLFGFEIGVDDYVVKPFSPKEVMARINAIINRSKSMENNKKLEFDGLKIDLDGMDVYVDDKKIDITPKEYELLVYLAMNKNKAMSREKLLKEVWGYDFYGDDRTIDTHIKMLRNNIEPYRDYIVTLRGVGYKFEYKG